MLPLIKGYTIVGWKKKFGILTWSQVSKLSYSAHPESMATKVHPLNDLMLGNVYWNVQLNLKRKIEIKFAKSISHLNYYFAP